MTRGWTPVEIVEDELRHVDVVHEGEFGTVCCGTDIPDHEVRHVARRIVERLEQAEHLRSMMARR